MGYLWEENLDELSPYRGIQGLIVFRARTLTGLGTSSNSDIYRATNFYGTRSLIGSELWELSTDDSSLDWDYLQDLTFGELGTLSGAQNFTGFGTLSELQLHRLGTLLGTLLLRDYQMNFHWNSGSLLYGLDP